MKKKTKENNEKKHPLIMAITLILFLAYIIYVMFFVIDTLDELLMFHLGIIAVGILFVPVLIINKNERRLK